MDLFDLSENASRNVPLAEKMRPKTLDEFIGQEHLLGKNNLLRKAIEEDKLGSCIFYGPPGVGKTTLANIIASNTKGDFIKLNAVSSGVGDAKKVIENALEQKKLFGKKTYLFLDECHRWSKAQSDCVLGAIEKGDIIFIGSTTENPYVSMTKAILSRCRIFEFKKLNREDIKKAIINALNSEKGFKDYNIKIDADAIDKLIWMSDGDVRKALNGLENAVLTAPLTKDGSININSDIIAESMQAKNYAIDESLYYDMLSAFCKSLRGSDSDAAVYWSRRMIKAGIEPLIIARRLIAHSAEDVGMADPNALVMAVSAFTALEKLGLPEGEIPLTTAIIYVCEAPKSNSTVVAIANADRAVDECENESVPLYLCDQNYKSEKISGYKYPHDFGGYVDQQYLPDGVKDREIYIPLNNGFEKNIIKKKSKNK